MYDINEKTMIKQSPEQQIIVGGTQDESDALKIRLENPQFFYNRFMPFLLVTIILLTLGTIAFVVLSWLKLNNVLVPAFPPSIALPVIIVCTIFSLLGFVSIVSLYHFEGNKQKQLLSNPPSALLVHEPSLFYFILKRFIDIVLSILGIIMLVPIFMVIALCIKLDDRGNIFHFREVVGYQGRRFYALKFRTMIPDAEKYLTKHPELMQRFRQNMKTTHDLRITRIGSFLRKSSLDELPQLFNVLIGQMTLVGPHIIHPSELSRYGEFAAKRLSVKPGITGLWQITGRQHVSYDERVLLDMQYIDTRSLRVDLAILLKTTKVFIVHTGA